MRQPNLIGLVGRAGVGKDTVAGLLAPYGYRRVAFADAMRDGAYESDPLIEVSEHTHRRLTDLVNTHGWDTCKRLVPDVRRYLQRYGTAIRRQLPDCWVDIVDDKIGDAFDAGRHVVVTDVRFDDEARLICKRGGTLVRIARPDADDLGENAQHVTERSVDDITCTVTLDNSSTLDDLGETVRWLHQLVMGQAVT